LLDEDRIARAPHAGAISGRLAALAEQLPHRVALRDLTSSLSFAELARRTEAVAGVLASGLPPGSGPVAVLAPLDLRFHIAFLGVIRAGRIALVLDPEHPPERLRRIARHAGAEAVITSSELLAQSRTLLDPGLPVIPVEQAAQSALPAGPFPSPEAPAYILYTSGSTGTPKGVVHSQANALNDAAINRDQGLTPADRGAIYYAGTIGTVRNSLGILMAGGELNVLPARQLGAEALVAEIRRRRLSIIQCVPTLFRRIAAQALKDGPLDSVRLARLTGERSHWSDLDLLRQAAGPEAELHVSIGSTECSSTFAFWRVDERFRTPGGRLPVGRPIDSLRVTLVDGAGAAVADGEPGEAVVAGPGLALGYWREPELTAAAFGVSVDDPGLRTFATGDICLRRPDGLIEYLGRADRMVKIRGHRLEPDEVEVALRNCPGVEDAVVVVRNRADGRPVALAAYAERAADGAGLRPRHLLAMLSRTLPDYMLPAAIHIGPLPRLANFKPDRQAVARMDAQTAQDRSSRRRRFAADGRADAGAAAPLRDRDAQGRLPSQPQHRRARGLARRADRHGAGRRGARAPGLTPPGPALSRWRHA